MGRMSVASSPVQSLVSGLQETTRELAKQAQQLSDSKQHLATTNVLITQRCQNTTQDLVMLQGKLALSEQLLLAMIDQMQRLQAASNESMADRDELLSNACHEARLRRAAATIGGEGYTALQ